MEASVCLVTNTWLWEEALLSHPVVAVIESSAKLDKHGRKVWLKINVVESDQINRVNC